MRSFTTITEEPRVENHTKHATSGSYKALGIEMAIDFVIMYLVMYTMIESVGHLYLNVNNVYMTLMMVAPMAVVMLVSMRSMFRNKNLNLAIGVTAAAIFAASFFAMRTQASVGDRQFLRSMIPHHSGAILMCEEANLRDPEIVALCRDIVASQKAEIAKMEQLLAR
jgi:uncharacterized protein (DUF305 family)